MHLWNIVLSYCALLILLLSTGVVTSAKTHKHRRLTKKHRQEGREDWRPFRTQTSQGRSSNTFDFLTSPSSESQGRADEGRGFMKMWKGMWNQPENNIIIITQPAPTTTTATTSPTTTAATTTAAGGDNGGGGGGGGARDDSLFQLQMEQSDDILNHPAFNVDPTNILGTNLLSNSNYGRNRKNQASKRRSANGKRRFNNGNRNRRRNQRPHQRNRLLAEQIAQTVSNKPLGNANVFAINTGGGGGSNGSSSSSSSSPSGLNINANERIQSIMNALRQQTPIVYNY